MTEKQLQETGETDLSVLMAKVMGLRQAGVPLNSIKSVLRRAEGDVLLAYGFYESQGLLVNVKGGPDKQKNWTLNHAKAVASRYRLTDDFQILPLENRP